MKGINNSSIFERTEKLLELLNERKSIGGYTEFDLTTYEGELKKIRKKSVNKNNLTIQNKNK